MLRALWNGTVAKRPPELYCEVTPYVPSIRAVVKELETLKSIDGIIIQDKWATVSIFYRQCSNKQLARDAILKLLNNSPHARKLCIIEEKMVYGIIPPVEINKGTAVTELIHKYRLCSGIFLGDDTADIAGFKAIRGNNRDFHGLAIAVVNEETPAEVIKEADFILNSVQETELLLKWLADNCV